jgi:cell division protein ZapB
LLSIEIKGLKRTKEINGAMSEDRFQSLSDKIDALIKQSGQMRQENKVLKSTEQHWHSEKQALLEKNKAAKTRLESILLRLKSLDDA